MTKSTSIVFSGMQPSGELHIGNYLGALKQWVEIQNSGKFQSFFFIADYHSLSEDYDPKLKQQQIRDLAISYLAAGLDPEKSTIFVQSAVPACTELSWILTSLTPVAELERMTQFKDKSSKQTQNINAGLLMYPVLQAADILLYHGTHVPVGKDQIQHVEITRSIARWFNNKYGVEYFPEPEPLVTKTPRVMSLVDPEHKMSKSAGDKHWIGINEDEEAITAKLKKAVTTPEGIASLREMYNALSQTMEAPFDDENMAKTKVTLAHGIASHFAAYRERRAELETRPEFVEEVLAKGAEKARAVAEKTMSEVKKIIGLS
jgi:tryptophanyl-tRNA synthetase